MIDFELELLNQNDDWRLLLAAYSDASRREKDSNPEFDGWLQRLSSVNAVKDERLPRIHGKLIALGLLKFQLGSRSAGVLYQVSGDGQRALQNLAQRPAIEDGESPLAQSA